MDGAPRAQGALNHFGTRSTRLDIVDAAAGEIVAGDLPELAQTPGLVITPDQSVVLDAKPDPKPKNPKGNPHNPPAPYSSGEDWPAAVGADQLWPAPGEPSRPRSPKGPDTTPSIAFVDSGIDASRSRLRRPSARPARHDFARGQLARRRQRPRNARRGPRRRLGAEPCGRRPDGRDRLAGRDGRPGHGAHERRDRGRPVDPQEPSRVQHPGRELLAPLGDPDQLPLGPARQGRREALVRGCRRRGCLRQPGPGRAADADGLRARERPVRDHGRCARPAQLDQSGPRRPGSVVGLGLHARRLRQARAERARPRDRRPRAGRLDARGREAGAGHPHARGHLHATFRHVALGADRLRHRGRPADAQTRRFPRTRSRAR